MIVEVLESTAGLGVHDTVISVVGEPLRPSLRSFLPTLTPGSDPSTTNAEMPLTRSSPVRAKTTNRSASLPVVIHSLAPFIT